MSLNDQYVKAEAWRLEGILNMVRRGDFSFRFALEQLVEPLGGFLSTPGRIGAVIDRYTKHLGTSYNGEHASAQPLVVMAGTLLDIISCYENDPKEERLERIIYHRLLLWGYLANSVQPGPPTSWADDLVKIEGGEQMVIDALRKADEVRWDAKTEPWQIDPWLLGWNTDTFISLVALQCNAVRQGHSFDI